MNKKTLIFGFSILLISLLANSAIAYQIRTNWQDSDSPIRSIDGAHVITENGDLESKLWVSFVVLANFTVKHHNLTIYFDPFEHTNNKPITNLSVAICDKPWSFGSSYDTGYGGACTYSYPIANSSYQHERYFIDDNTGTYRIINYSSYLFTFVPNESNGWQDYFILINYTVPKFIFKQGEYSVAWLSIQNNKDQGYGITNSVVLPTKDDIPRFIPDAKKIERMPYIENNRVYYRWTFLFEGDADRIIWYWNNKEAQAKTKELQEHYTNEGVKKGFWLSILGAIAVLFLEKLIFDWTPLGTKILIWTLKKVRPAYVIGNKTGKIYHSLTCEYIDNIYGKNRVVFNNILEAEKEGYKPCTRCNKNQKEGRQEQ